MVFNFVRFTTQIYASITYRPKTYSIKNKNIVQRSPDVKYTRIEVPEIEASDIFEDAFRPISRDGAGNIEVMIRMQKALTSIYSFVPDNVKEVVLKSAHEAYERAELAISYAGDLDLLKQVSLHYKVTALADEH